MGHNVEYAYVLNYTNLLSLLNYQRLLLSSTFKCDYKTTAYQAAHFMQLRGL